MAACACGYERRLQKLDEQELQRYVAHAAAWITKTLCHGDSDVLQRVLPQVRSGKVSICPCLLGQTGWDRVKELVPEDVASEDKGKALEAPFQAPKPKKSLYLFQKTIQTWKNQVPEQRLCYVTSLEEELQQLKRLSSETGLVDMKRLRSIFRRAVAALSPPRLAGTDGEESEERIHGAVLGGRLEWEKYD